MVEQTKTSARAFVMTWGMSFTVTIWDTLPKPTQQGSPSEFLRRLARPALSIPQTWPSLRPLLLPPTSSYRLVLPLRLARRRWTAVLWSVSWLLTAATATRILRWFDSSAGGVAGQRGLRGGTTGGGG